MLSSAPSKRAAKGTVGFSLQRIAAGTRFDFSTTRKGNLMNSIVYIVGAIVIIGAVLSFLGLR
jgi:hypothetical protein